VIESLLAYLLDPIVSRLQRRWPGINARRWVGIGFYLLLALLFPAIVTSVNAIFARQP
jgi:predicted PurR-regulated permease PerM